MIIYSYRLYSYKGLTELMVIHVITYKWLHNKGSNPIPSDIYIVRHALLPSEPPDSLMAEECRIVLIPKLTSNPAVSYSLKDRFNWFKLLNNNQKVLGLIPSLISNFCQYLCF